LLQHGADPTIRDQMWQSTAIGWFDGGKQAAMIDELFQHSDVDILDAVELRRYEIVRRLLERDRSLANAPEEKGGALRFAAFKGDARMIRLLLEFGADATLQNDNGHSALDYARQGKHAEVLQPLQDSISPS
jgi:ankyrin repeat protein